MHTQSSASGFQTERGGNSCKENGAYNNANDVTSSCSVFSINNYVQTFFSDAEHFYCNWFFMCRSADGV